MKWMALFAEAQKGSFEEGVEIYTPIELLHLFGHPPEDARGMVLAIQALHYNHPLLFFRVKEEGFSAPDYRAGLHWLEQKGPLHLRGVFAPGVGSLEILNPLFQFSQKQKVPLLTTEQDFFDFICS